jgi:hypothetical protein
MRNNFLRLPPGRTSEPLVMQAETAQQIGWFHEGSREQNGFSPEDKQAQSLRAARSFPEGIFVP